MTPVLLAPIPAEDTTRREFITGVGAAALAAAFLAACGGEDGAAPAPEDTTVQIDDYFGVVTVPEHPERVVAGAGYIGANMLALDVAPIAVTAGYPDLAARFGDRMRGVTDVGRDLERALTLDPDLAILPVSADNADSIAFYEAYQAAVPTFGYEYGYAYIEELIFGLTEVARALNVPDRAETVVDQYHARVAALRERIVAAGLTDKPVSVIRYRGDGNYSVRFGTSEAIVFRALGMALPADQQNPEDFAFTLSLEELNHLNDVHTLFIYTDDATGAEEIAGLSGNPIWESLGPVKAGRVHTVETGIWFNSDIPSLMSIIDDIERLFVAPAEA